MSSTTLHVIKKKRSRANLVNCAFLCAHRGEGDAEKEGSKRSLVADREICVHTSSNTNRRCRPDKEIEGKGATQINQD